MVVAGKEGIAVTFVNPIEMDYIRQIEDVNGRRMNALRPPHRKEVLKAREDDIKEKFKIGCLKIMKRAFNVLQVNY